MSNCLDCDKEFKTRTSGCRKKFCSIKCRIKYNTQRQSVGVTKFITLSEQERTSQCQNCKNSYIKIQFNQKYCSKNCLEIYKNKQVQSAGRFLLFNRDNFTCIYCARSSFEDKVKLTLDHIYPKVKGGKDLANNLITCCNDCNGEKGIKFLTEDSIKRLLKIIYERNVQFNIHQETIIKFTPRSYERKN